MSEHDHEHAPHHGGRGISENKFFAGLAVVLAVAVFGFAFLYSQVESLKTSSSSSEVVALASKVSSLESKVSALESGGAATATAAPAALVEFLLYYDSSDPFTVEAAANVPAFNENLKKQDAGLQIRAIDFAGKKNELLAAGFESLPAVFLSDDEASKNQKIKDSFANAPRVTGGFGLDATQLQLSSSKTLLKASSCAKAGKAVLYEFSDFQCPYCSRIAPQVRLLEAEFGAGLELVFKHFPLSFHENAQNASEAALCAGDQGKFDAYHDKLFENQDSLDSASLKKFAADLKLDTSKFNKCLDNHDKKAAVEADLEEGAQAYGVGGTPTFVMDCLHVFGAASKADLKKQVCTGHADLAACKK